MVEITIDTEKFKLISVFSSIMGITAVDCIVDDKSGKLIYLIPEKDYILFELSLKSKIRLLENLLKRRIEVISFSKDPVKFVKNILKPIKVKEVYIAQRDNGKKVLRIQLIKSRYNNPAKIKKVKHLVGRYFKDVDEIIIR